MYDRFASDILNSTQQSRESLGNWFLSLVSITLLLAWSPSPPPSFTSSLLHLLHPSPPHFFTSSILHLLTSSPPPFFTAPPPSVPPSITLPSLPSVKFNFNFLPACWLPSCQGGTFIPPTASMHGIKNTTTVKGFYFTLILRLIVIPRLLFSTVLHTVQKSMQGAWERGQVRVYQQWNLGTVLVDLLLQAK